MIRGLLPLLLVVALSAGRASADEPAVPLDLQVDLISKILKYDRDFSARANPLAKVLIVRRPGNVDSERIARQMKAALGAAPTLGGAKHSEEEVLYTSADALVSMARARKVCLVIFASGFDDEATNVARAFDGFDGLTATTQASAVEKGIVLGFDLVSGRPKMLLNLRQARKQNADFRSDVLKIMKVYE